MGRYRVLAPSSANAPVPSSAIASAPSSPNATAPSSPNAFVGDPASSTIAQRATNIIHATQNEQTGFPPKARGNDGNTGGGL